MAKAGARKCALLIARAVRQASLLGALASLGQACGGRVDADDRCSAMRCDPRARSSGAARQVNEHGSFAKPQVVAAADEGVEIVLGG